MNRWRWWVALAGLLALGVADADSWVRPELRVVASEHGEYLARIVPGDRNIHARALLYRYDASQDGYRKLADYALQDTWAPVDVLLAGDGGLVTLDAWASMGKGTVLRVYNPDGGLRFGHALADLGGERASLAPASVSSLWWRCGKPMLIEGGAALRVVTWDEGELRVNLDDGTVQHHPGQGRCR